MNADLELWRLRRGLGSRGGLPAPALRHQTCPAHQQQHRRQRGEHFKVAVLGQLRDGAKNWRTCFGLGKRLKQLVVGGPLESYPIHNW